MRKQLICSVKHLTQSLVAAASSLREKAELSGKRGFGGGSPRQPNQPFAGEAERSGKRGYCAAFNEALPVQQRLNALHKVCALAFEFQRSDTVRSDAQRPALHSAQRYTAPSASLRTALHCAHRCAV